MALHIIRNGTTGQGDGTIEVPDDGAGLTVTALNTAVTFHLRCDTYEETGESVTVNAPANCNVSKDNVSYGSTAVYSAGEIADTNVVCYLKQTAYSAIQNIGLALTPRAAAVAIVSMGSGIDVYTKLMLHMNGVDGSIVFTDSELAPIKTITRQVQAQIDTAQSKFGGASGWFDGSSYLTTPDHDDFSFGIGDWTIDFWVRFNSLTGVQSFIAQRQDAAHNWAIRKESDGRLSLWFYYVTGFMGYYITTNVPTIAINTWYHIEVARQGETAYLFVNGTAQALTVNNAFSTNNLGYYAATVTIAAYDHAAPSGVFFGWLDEFRVSKGTARHVTNFTPPISEYAE